MGCVSYEQRTNLVILRKRLCFMYKHLERGSWVLLISGNEEIEHARNRLLIRILVRRMSDRGFGRCTDGREGQDLYVNDKNDRREL